MSEEKTVFQFKCLKCKNDTFSIRIVVHRKFFFDGEDLTVPVWVCTKCGWKSHPEEREALKVFLHNLLKSYSPGKR